MTARIDMAEVRRLYETDGLSVEQISMRVHVSAKTLRHRMINEGIKLRPKGNATGTQVRRAGAR